MVYPHKRNSQFAKTSHNLNSINSSNNSKHFLRTVERKMNRRCMSLPIMIIAMVTTLAAIYIVMQEPPVAEGPSPEEIQKMIKSAVKKEMTKHMAEINSRIVEKKYPPVGVLSIMERKRILVTGGAGFVGSHLVDSLMQQGHEVTVVDNFFTGRKQNVQQWVGHPHFELINHDITQPLYLEVNEIYHLACPASPPHYKLNPIKTIKTNVQGTLNMLGLAKRVKAKILLASTSEVYGDPRENPQKEIYWGHVNPIGPRACYDEGKRVAETMMVAYRDQANSPLKDKTRIARIFNTYGPRMHPNDGRVVSNFIIKALQKQPLEIYGEGQQTRAFQYVSDLVNGLMKLMNSNYLQPVNLGNPDEMTIRQFAQRVVAKIDQSVRITNLPKSQDDPQQRRPDISRAKEQIKWEPIVPLEDGLEKTIDYFRKELGVSVKKNVV
eukprot:Nk52_evm1s1014 gene=Nk52_evmTU1s1014